MATERPAILIFPAGDWGRKRAGKRDGECIEEAREALIEALTDSDHHMAGELVEWVEDGEIRVINYKPLSTGGGRGGKYEH